MSTTTKPLVLVVGATGNVGTVVLNTLAAIGSWRLAALVRPNSVSKPQVTALKDLGVDIRPSDWQNDSPDQLDKVFAGVDILISTVSAEAITSQKVLVDAAKRANVKRFIPCDFGTACIPGVRDMYDEKLEVHKYLKQTGVPYTFIDVGYWMRIVVPYKAADEGYIQNLVREWYGDGQKKSAVVDMVNIGSFVARIIADPRTLNQYVFIYDDEVTMNEVYEIGCRVSGEDLHKVKVVVSEEDVLKRAAEGKAEYQTSGGALPHARWSWYQYIHSMYFAGHNTTEIARSQGALIGKELYPDLKFRSVEEYAKKFYTEGTEKIQY